MVKREEYPATVAAVSGATGRWSLTGLRAAAGVMRDLTVGSVGTEPLSALANRICSTQAYHAKARATIFLAQGDRLVPYSSARPDVEADTRMWSLFIFATEPLPLAVAVRDTGRPQLAADAASPLVAGWWGDTFGLTSACAVPLGPPGAVIGVLVFDRPEPDAFDEAFRLRAVAAASDVTAVLEWGLLTENVLSDQRINAATRRLLAESAGATSVFAAASTVAEIVHDVLHTERTIVFYQRDPDLPELEVAAVGMPSDADRIVRDVVAELALSAAPRVRQLSSTDGAVFFETVRPGMVRAGGIAERLGVRSFLSLPLSTGTGRVGHIFAGDVSGARPWRPWERKFVGQLAAEATLVMESASLREIDQTNRERLLHQATHDALTNLANRRVFGVRLTDALEAAAGTGQPLSLLLLDVDRFKSVNDTLGHPAGDRLLVEVARSLVDVVRGPDLAAMLGGDEFAVLLPGADHCQAELVAARVSEAVDAACRRARVPPGVAISIGISVYPDDGVDGEALLQAADAAMYQAKRSGARHGASGAGDLTTRRGLIG